MLAHRVSITMEADFCIEALQEAILKYGGPDIMNTDQGSQFTGAEFIGTLNQHGIAISMDGRGQWRDNVFVERLWKSVKYEEVYLKAYETVSDARAGIAWYIDFYNTRRPHRTHGGQTPDAVYIASLPPIQILARVSHRGGICTASASSLQPPKAFKSFDPFGEPQPVQASHPALAA